MSIRILLVDDDSLVMESLEILFSTDTKIVIVGTATSGAQAIQ